MGRQEALRMQVEREEALRKEIEEKKQQGELARRATGRAITIHLERIPPTGKDIFPFRYYQLPNKDETLDCPQ